MVPATALPEAGIAPVIDPVTYNVLPEPVAYIALLGEAEGLGVGTPTVYVGDSVGAFVGAFEGK
jgi:hypothetical protein